MKLEELSEAQQRRLRECAGTPLPVKGRHLVRVLNALEDKGLVEVRGIKILVLKDHYHITDAGLAVLANDNSMET
jgi:hypothetical protein